MCCRSSPPATSPTSRSRTRPAPTSPSGRSPIVKEDHQPLAGDAIVDDGPGLLLVVEKLPWGNALQVTQGVDDVIKSLQPGLPNVVFDTHIFRQANFINTSIHNLTEALLLGFLLVLVILVSFLYEWRAALISLRRPSRCR